MQTWRAEVFRSCELGIPAQWAASSFQDLKTGAVTKNEDDLPSMPRGAWIYNLINKKCSNELVVPQKRISIQLCSTTISSEKNSSFPSEGFPGGSAGKESACSVRELGSIACTHTRKHTPSFLQVSHLHVKVPKDPWSCVRTHLSTAFFSIFIFQSIGGDIF